MTEGKEFPDNSLIVGAPARVIRTLDEKAAEMIRGGADIYVRRWKEYAKGLKAFEIGATTPSRVFARKSGTARRCRRFAKTCFGGHGGTRCKPRP